MPKLAFCGNFQVLIKFSSDSLSSLRAWEGLVSGAGAGRLCRAPGLQLSPWTAPWPGWAQPPRLGLGGGHLSQKRRTVNSSGRMLPSERGNTRAQHLLFREKSPVQPEDDAVRCPCGIKEPAGRSPFVPSDSTAWPPAVAGFPGSLKSAELILGAFPLSSSCSPPPPLPGSS